MKHFLCPALSLLLLVGCSEMRPGASSGASCCGDHSKDKIVVPTMPTLEFPADVTPADAPSEEPPTSAESWLPLFDGDSMAGWMVPVYGGDGDVDVHEGNIVIGRGEMMTGIRYENEFPKVNYEIRYEARRTQGYDFFASCTFPVKESYCTFINGGWSGGLTGISSVDGLDASENSTSAYFAYKENVWYRFRIQVTDDKIQVWLTPQDAEGNWEEEKSVVELETTDRTLSTRYEVERYKPLGFCTWTSEGQLRKIEYRNL